MNFNDRSAIAFKNVKKYIFLFVLLFLFVFNKSLTAQYTTQGICTQNGNIFTLVGSMESPYTGRFWKNTKIDLTNDFEVNIDIAFGSSDYSNGLAFILQRASQPSASSPAITSADILNTTFGCNSIANMFGITMPLIGQYCGPGQNTNYFPVTSQPRIDMVKDIFRCNSANYFGTYGLISQGGAFNYYTFQPYKITYVKSTNTISTYFNNVLIKSAVVDLSSLLGGSDAWWGFSAGEFAYSGYPQVRVIEPPSIIDFSPGTGNSGTVVTITGTNFTGASAVNFGGTPASSFEVVNSTTINATVAEGTTGNVSISGPGGTGSLSGFTFCTPITPTINITASPSTSICEGSNITFTAAAINGGTSPVYQWKKNGGNVGNNSNQYVDAGINNGDIINCMLTSNDACASPVNASSNILPISVNEMPTVIVSNNGTVCSGTNTAFTLTGTAGATVTYNLNGNSNTSTTLAGGTATISLTNIQSIQILNLVSITSGACSKILNSSSTINVNSLPIVGFTASPSTSICNGTSVTLSGSGASDYTWSSGVSNEVPFIASYVPLLTAKIDISTANLPLDVTTADIDGDGKLDVLVANYLSNTLSIYRNIASAGSINTGSLAAKVDFPTGINPSHISIADIDGDGKKDIIVVNSSDNTVSIFRNLSTAGNITTGSLATKVDFATGNSPAASVTGDIDGNGKIDIAVANNGDGSVSVLKNSSTPGIISMDAKVDFTVDGSPGDIAIADIDGDTKLDLLVSSLSNNTVSVLRNTSVVGNITDSSFAEKVDFATGSFPARLTSADIDGDGRMDIIVSSANSSALSVLWNTAVIGTINNSSFAAKVDFAVTGNPWGIEAEDMDGDGKIDILLTNIGDNTISYFRNTSMPGAINSASLAAKVNFTASSLAVAISLADIDGDGKKDAVIVDRLSNTLSLFRNQLKSYTVTGINASGCTDSTTLILSVNPLQSPALTITPSSPSICMGNSTSLMAGGAIAYSWNPSTGLNTTNGATVIASPVATTLYTMSGTASNGCVNNKNVTVTVNPLPNVGFTASPSTTICQGTEVVLSGTGAASYLWTGGVNNAISFIPVSSGSYTVTGTDVNGCTNTATSVITLLPVPAVPSITANGPVSFCQGGSVGLTAGIAPGNALAFDGVNDYVNMSKRVVPTSGDFTVEFWVKMRSVPSPDFTEFISQGTSGSAFYIGTSTVTGQLRCGDNWQISGINFTLNNWIHLAIVKSGTNATLYINGSQVATKSNYSISASGDNTKLCKQYSSYTEYADVLLDEMRIWNVARSPAQVSSSYNIELPANAVGLIAYYKFDETGGTTLQDVTGNSSNNGVLINGASWTTSTAPLVSNDTYLWSSGETSTSILATTSGNYTVSQINSFGCSNTSSPVTIAVNELPIVNFTGLSAEYCTADVSVTLTANHGGGTFTGAGITDNGNGTSIFNPAIAGSGGPYTVTYNYINSNGCSASATKQVSVSVCPTFTLLNLKAYLEGFYTGEGTMQSTLYNLELSADPTATDNIIVSLWNPANLSSETPDYSSTTLLHSDGTATIQFPASVANNSYFIAIRHRNSIETWSKLPISFTDITYYDFSSGLDKAYDDGINPPMNFLGNGIYAIYGGDVNQDGTIDASDMAIVDNEKEEFLYGYNISDVNGDAVTDASDVAIVDNNKLLFLYFARPY